jgi:hypothetical protein
MKINFKKLLTITLAVFAFGTALAQSNATQNAFDGHYQRRNVSGLNGKS